MVCASELGELSGQLHEISINVIQVSSNAAGLAFYLVSIIIKSSSSINLICINSIDHDRYIIFLRIVHLFATHIYKIKQVIIHQYFFLLEYS